MKISPIVSNLKQSKTFKGYMVENAGYHDVVAAEKTGRRMEKGQAIHQQRKIYYADPLEEVSDYLRARVDYVVYDDEPAFPDVNYEISKAFFHPEDSMLGKNVEDIFKFKNYFYRMEMADRKKVGDLENKIWRNEDAENSRRESARLQQRIADASYNQTVAHEFLETLNESHDLRTKNNSNYLKIKQIEDDIAGYESRAPRAEIELARRIEVDSILEKKVSTLKKQIKSCETFAKIAEEMKGIDTSAIEYSIPNEKDEKYWHYYQNTDSNGSPWVEVASTFAFYKGVKENLSKNIAPNEQDDASVKQVLNNLKIQLEKYTQLKDTNKKSLNFLKKYVELLPSKLSSLKESLELAKKAFEKSKADLIPHFDKLKNYITNKGLRVVR